MSARHFRRAGAIAAIGLAAFISDHGTARGSKFLKIPEAADGESSPAYRYANLSNEEAFAALAERRIPYRNVVGEPARGVRAPIRLTGRLHGVLIRSTLPEAEWETTPYNILDARLALALDDMCRILSHHDVDELVHFTMYRLPKTKGDQPQFRHPGGLAIDLGAIKKKNGEWLSVGPHWPGKIGAKTCGTRARKLVGRRGRELVSILCEISDQRIFHYILSPHFDRAHDDHWHMEIKPGVKWFLIH